VKAPSDLQFSTHRAKLFGSVRLRYLVRLTFLFSFLLLGVPLASAQSAPVLFFSDLTSAPNNHGESVGRFSGAYVTLYGNFFGPAQGSSTVTLNGKKCLRVAAWGTPWLWYQKIVVQLGLSCSSGSFVVTVNGVASNPLPFVVATGHIFFVSKEGSDRSNGSFAKPWKTIPHAVQAAGTGAGNIIYVRDGVSQLSDDSQGWRAALLLRTEWCKGTADQPDALVSYPNADVAIGTISGPESAIRSTGASAGGGACPGNWTFAGLLLRGAAMGVQLSGQSGTSPSRNWRIAGNDISCPNGNGATGCLAVSDSSNLAVLGNDFHDIGRSGPPTASALYQGVYFSTDTNHVNFGWNIIANVRGCRGLQLYSTGGNNLYDYSIHDNTIHDTQCDGILLANTDPSRGPVSVFNNVIYNAGQGPNNPERTGAWQCIYLAASTNRGPVGQGTVVVFNNTFYNCGGFRTPPYAGSSGAVRDEGRDPIKIDLQNNILYQLNPSAPYYDNQNALPDGIYGRNNIMYGIGRPPSDSFMAGTLYGNPGFVNPGADFHLANLNSVANHAGSSTSPLVAYDHDGVRRESPPAIGAYEYILSSEKTSVTLHPVQ
jgi:hypothetical protein